jgi:hypothetical protein
MYILIYVDDIIITCSNSSAIDTFLKLLNTDLSIKDLGPLHFFFGIDVINNTADFLLSHQRYILDILCHTNMVATKHVSSLMSTTNSLSAFDGTSFDDPILYRSIVGALKYLCITRSDISYTVKKLSQFMLQPTVLHWQSVKKLLRFLKETFHFGVQFQKSISTTLQAYTNANYAGSRDDRRSTGGYCIFLGPNLISWSCCKHATMARSSKEVEYNLSSKNLEFPLHKHHSNATTLAPCISLPILSFMLAPSMWGLTSTFVHEMVASKSLDIRFLYNRDQLADVFTKPLLTSHFALLCSKLA